MMVRQSRRLASKIASKKISSASRKLTVLTRKKPTHLVSASQSISSASRKRAVLLREKSSQLLASVTQKVSSNSASRSKKVKGITPPLPKQRPPVGWERIYETMSILREDRDAPVDTLGGAALPENNVSPAVRRYQVLISLLLSSQTKDVTNAIAMRRLQQHGLTIDKILATPAKVLNDLIKMVGFHNNKTKYILETSSILKEKFNSDVPNRIEDLVSLPGIGPKMGFIILSVAHGICDGIGVDTHVHRICKQIGWTKENISVVENPKKKRKKMKFSPESTRIQLESWLPKQLWAEINVLMVGIGQEIHTEKAKLLRKCIAIDQKKRKKRNRYILCKSEPEITSMEALALVKRLGLNVEKVAREESIQLKAEWIEKLKEIKK
eukprot:g2285.t1